jgi:hypothetical protein
MSNKSIIFLLYALFVSCSPNSNYKTAEKQESIFEHFFDDSACSRSITVTDNGEISSKIWRHHGDSIFFIDYYMEYPPIMNNELFLDFVDTSLLKEPSIHFLRFEGSEITTMFARSTCYPIEHLDFGFYSPMNPHNSKLYSERDIFSLELNSNLDSINIQISFTDEENQIIKRLPWKKYEIQEDIH